MLGPVANTVLKRYSKKMSVSWTPDRRVTVLVEAALKFNKLASVAK